MNEIDVMKTNSVKGWEKSIYGS